MDCVLETNIDSLPDEVLAAVLKVVADMPVNWWDRTPPFPVAASRVSRRWRAVALSFPELWTNIRISHRTRSWTWAALFVKRSRSCLLDISINLESYVYDFRHSCFYKTKRPAFPAYVPVSKALAIVGPHVGRWRTIAVRGWDNQLQELFEFLRGQGAACRAQSAHFSVVDLQGLDTQLPELHELPALLGIGTLRSLRVNAEWSRQNFQRILHIQLLDVNLGGFCPFDPH